MERLKNKEMSDKYEIMHLTEQLEKDVAKVICNCQLDPIIVENKRLDLITASACIHECILVGKAIGIDVSVLERLNKELSEIIVGNPVNEESNESK